MASGLLQSINASLNIGVNADSRWEHITKRLQIHVNTLQKCTQIYKNVK